MVSSRALFLAGFASLAAAAAVTPDASIAAPPSQVAGVSAASASTTLKQTNICCTALKTILGSDKVFVQGSCGYKDSLASYWTQQESSLAPACIVSPRSTLDVSLAVFTLNIGSAVLGGQCNFAVRSGGHTPFAGAANIQGGITIDLKLVNQVTVAKDRKSVTIGPGNRWADVYAVTDPLNLAVLGGRISTVGVGGLVTGGGFSNFSPRFGLVCDQVESFEVVLATGKIVTASATTNADLWRALRGGSNNFGIVTAFKMTAFEQAPYWGGVIISADASQIPGQIAGLAELTDSPSYDPYAAMVLNLVWLDGANDVWGTVNSPAYTKYTTGDPLPPPALANVTTLNGAIVNSMRIGKTGDFAKDLQSPTGLRQLMATLTFKNSAAMMQAVFDMTKPAVQPWRTVPGIGLSIAFQPEPTVIAAASAARGGNVLGHDVSDGNTVNLLMTVNWNDAADDALIDSIARSLFDQYSAKAAELGVTNNYIYLNYAAKWQDPISGYGADNKAFLQQVSKKYDPQGRFQKNVPGGFKLF